jgi:hypothetical protein
MQFLSGKLKLQQSSAMRMLNRGRAATVLPNGLMRLSRVMWETVRT